MSDENETPPEDQPVPDKKQPEISVNMAELIKAQQHLHQVASILLKTPPIGAFLALHVHTISLVAVLDKLIEGISTSIIIPKGTVKQ